MQALNAFNTMIAHSGMSKAQVALSMGRNNNYIRQTISRRSVPRADIMAEIADTCGYDLLLSKRDGSEVIVIDPPEDPQS